MKLFLIRHGETKSNKERKFIGITDEELSEEGRNKLLLLKDKGLYVTPDMLFVSPMKRCIQSAEILFSSVPYTCIQEFREIDFGIFEGKNHEELDGNIHYQQWIDSGGELPIKRGGSRLDFITHTIKGFGRMMSLVRGDNVTAVVHGGTIMALLSGLYGGNFYDYMTHCGEGYECNVNITDSDSVWISDVKKIC